MTGTTDGGVWGVSLYPQHRAMLAASGITPDHARARGYVTVDTKIHLESIGITPAGRHVPGLLIPMRDAGGSVWGYQYRPDDPRTNANGKPVKYETPVRQCNGLDVPPGVGPLLADPTVDLLITEGSRKADAAWLSGLACVALPGVWSWRGKNGKGGSTAISDWHDVALNDDRRVILAFDSDITRKPGVRSALTQLAGYLTTKGAHVHYCWLPDDTPGKTGLDDYLADGHTAADVLTLVHPDPPPLARPESPATARPAEPAPPPEPVTLQECHATFRKWLGEAYDTDALDAVLAAAAVEQLDGDPLWLLLISGPGNAKTETVQALSGAGAMVTSTISSEGALLSATSQRERSSNSTGGLLRKLGSRGVLVIKDVTSILSMNTNVRDPVLAAFREVYDGKWSRNVGTDGGRTLDWIGRLVVIGAVTTAWDQAHAVIASMGDRFVLVRMDSTVNRVPAGRRAIGNTGDEIVMRAELSAAVAGVLAGVMAGSGVTVTGLETEILLGAADLVTLTRTGVIYNYRGDVIDAHAPEVPTRFAKQLAQVIRGGVAIGMVRKEALRLAIRCARDSMPPLRLAVIDDVARHPESRTRDVRRRLGKPRATVDRGLQALQMLGVLACEEEEGEHRGEPVNIWRYRLADGIDPGSLRLDSVPEILLTTPDPQEREGMREETARSPRPGINISGTESAATRSTPQGVNVSPAAARSLFSTAEEQSSAPRTDPEPRPRSTPPAPRHNDRPVCSVCGADNLWSALYPQIPGGVCFRCGPTINGTVDGQATRPGDTTPQEGTA